MFGKVGYMWEELEKEIRLHTECDYLNLNTEAILGIGNKNAKYLILFDTVSETMQESMSIEKSLEYEKLNVIFNYCQIDMKSCYFTCLDKYYTKKEKIDYKKRKYAMSIFLKEIYLVKPEYIITVGENVLNYLYYYLTEKEEKIDILKSVGNTFKIGDICIVPIYDIFHISKLGVENKRKLTKILKEINK